MSRSRSRRGQQRHGTCAYCGAEGPITRDHVFPETLFVVKDPVQMVTVPACAACHDEKSRGDVVLRDFVNMDINGARHHNARWHLEKTARATTTNRSLVGRAFVEAGVEKDWFSDAGLFLGRGIEIPTDGFADVLLRTMAYVLRGLYFHETGERLPPDCPVEVALIQPHRIPQVFANLRRLPPTNIAIKADHVAGWVSWRPAADSLGSQWLIGFNNAVFFLGWTGRLAEDRRRFREHGGERAA